MLVDSDANYGSMTYGEQYKGQLVLPALWQGLWTAFVQLGIMIGAAGIGAFQDRFARRMAFVLGGVLSAIGKSTGQCFRTVFIDGS